MNNENPGINDHSQAIPPSGNPMQLYGGGDGLDDFPVLKAFQQYVDAEQTKAHRRVMSICVFFSVILTLVVAFFLFLLFNLKNQQNPAELTGAYREILETNSQLQRQMHEQTVSNYEQQLRLLRERTGVSAGEAALQQQNLELQKKLATLEIEQRLRAEAEAKARTEAASASAGDQNRQAELQRAESRLKEREDRLAAAEKRLREAEVELHRRRLYPEHYATVDAQPVQPASPPAAVPAPSPAPAPSLPAQAKPAAGQDDIDDIEDILRAVNEVTPKKKPQTKPAKKPAAVVQGVMQSDGTIRYFDDDEDTEAPAKPAASVKPAATQPAVKTAVKPAAKATAKPAAPATPVRPQAGTPTANWDLPLE